MKIISHPSCNANIVQKPWKYTTIHLHLIIMKLHFYNFEQLHIKMYKFGQGRI